jgi:hypothetical protein
MRKLRQLLGDASTWFAFYCHGFRGKNPMARLRRLNPAAPSLTRNRFPDGDDELVFLAKCTICILLVCVALQWRADHAPLAPKSAAARASTPQNASGFVQDVIERASSLSRAGGAALAGAARDKCLAAPRECLSAAQRLQSAAGRAQ